MRRFHDMFVKNNLRVKVNCYNEIGGSMKSFLIGDRVPNNKLDNDFISIALYGKNYNIFDSNEDCIIIIRYGIYVDIKHSCRLRDEETNCLCIDIDGNELELRTPQAYYDLARETEELNKRKKEYLIGLSKFLNGQEPVIYKKTLVEIISSKLKGFIKKHG